MQLDMRKFIRECYGKLIIQMALTTAIGYFLCNHIILISGWKGVIIKAIIVSVLYITVMSLTAVEERRFVVEIIKKKRKS